MDLPKFCPISPRSKIRAQVIRVIDGDTVHLAFSFRGRRWRYCFRLADINAAELKSKDPILREQALIAKRELTKLCGDEVYFQFVCIGHFGRFVARLYTLGDVDISQSLLDQQLVQPYIKYNKKV